MKFYNPKIKIQKFQKNNYKDFEVDILGNYLFCFHKSFEKKNVMSSLQYSRGLKYFLNGFENSQNDIEKFIKICTDAENTNGFLTQKIFELKLNKYYKFVNGPFASKVFQLIEIHKNKIEFKLGKIKSYICKKDIFLQTILRMRTLLLVWVRKHSHLCQTIFAH